MPEHHRPRGRDGLNRPHEPQRNHAPADSTPTTPHPTESTGDYQGAAIKRWIEV
jgi:hypothetical protein